MTIKKMLTDIGPTEASRSVGRRPQDGTRYIATLQKRIDELDQIAEDNGFQLIAVRPDLRQLLLATIDSAGDTISETEAMELLRAQINQHL